MDLTTNATQRLLLVKNFAEHNVADPIARRQVLSLALGLALATKVTPAAITTAISDLVGEYVNLHAVTVSLAASVINEVLYLDTDAVATSAQNFWVLRSLDAFGTTAPLNDKALGFFDRLFSVTSLFSAKEMELLNTNATAIFSIKNMFVDFMAAA